MFAWPRRNSCNLRRRCRGADKQPHPAVSFQSLNGFQSIILWNRSIPGRPQRPCPRSNINSLAFIDHHLIFQTESWKSCRFPVYEWSLIGMKGISRVEINGRWGGLHFVWWRKWNILLRRYGKRRFWRGFLFCRQCVNDVDCDIRHFTVVRH